MNGNDSVVKCLCFFRFLLSPSFFFSTAAQAVWQVSFCVAIGPADTVASRRMLDGLLIDARTVAGMFIKLIARGPTGVHRSRRWTICLCCVCGRYIGN